MDTRTSAIWALPVLAVLIAACSNGPTAPSQPSSPSVSTETAPGPPPAPPAPAPAPAPTPPPAPPPAPPAPAPLAVYAAVTASAQWKSPSPLVPERFTVEVFDQTVSFGPLRLPITSRNTIGNEVVGIMASDGDVIIAMERDRASWRWQLASGAGQAYGYMNRN